MIVGAGAVGSLVAAKLAGAGRSVRVLESGPPWQLSDLVSSQLWARRLKWGGAAVLSAGPDRINHNIGTGSGFGGAALHHYGTWPRFSTENFRVKSIYGRGRDWPIEYDDLRPYYDRIQAEVGISGDAEAETWRPPGAPYPMPPLKRFRQSYLLEQGFARLGLHTAPLPVAINSVPYRGRAACIDDGWCDAGCPIGALANPLVTYFPEARKASAVFDAGCNVTRVLLDRKGRASGVEYLQEGVIRQQPAGVVMLAASVSENPRILLNSSSDRFPAGLANSSGLVGRYLLPETTITAFGLFEEDTECYMGINAGHLTYREGYTSPRRPGVFAGYQWQVGPVMKPNDLFGVAATRPDIHGQKLHDFLYKASRHMGMMIAFGGGVSQEQDRFELSSQRDQNGMPLAQAVYSVSDDARRLVEHLKKESAAVFDAAGAYENWNGPVVTGHIVGGVIMGDKPADSVTDSYGACHDVDNLFVTGASLFPCSGGISPTYTIYALSLRTADRLIENWSAVSS